MDWKDLQKGDTIHAMIFCNKTLKYQYQECHVIQNKSDWNYIQFKFSDPNKNYKRTRINLYFYEVSSILFQDYRKVGCFGENFFAFDFDILNVFYNKFITNHLSGIKFEIIKLINQYKYIKSYAENYNPLQS